MNEWFTERLSFYPEEFMPLNPYTWIQRREVKEISDGQYECQSRKLNTQQYNEVLTQIDDIKRIIADLTDVAKYEEGYNAAMILLGEEA